MKKNNSLLVTILGGAIFCFVFLGLAFITTNNTKTMRGNTSNQEINYDEDINLGDEDTCAEWYYTYQCTPRYEVNGVMKCCERMQLPSEANNAEGCAGAGGVWDAGACYGCTSDATKVKTSCRKCKDGYVKQGATCTKCPDNYPNTDEGAEDISQCYLITNPGYGVPFQREGQQICPKASWSAGGEKVYYNAASICSQCPPGYSAEQEGSTSDEQCTVKTNGGWRLEMPETMTVGETSYAYFYYNAEAYDNPNDAITVKAASYDGILEVQGFGGTATSSPPPRIALHAIKPGTTTVHYGLYYTDGAYVNGSKTVTVVDQTFDSISGGGSAYVTPDKHKVFNIKATDSNGTVIKSGVTWKVEGLSSAISSETCSTSTDGDCTVIVKGWGCDHSATVRVTATYNGVSKTASIQVYSYAKWSQSDWNKPLPDNGYIYDGSALDHSVCIGYGEYDQATGNYKYRYNRCCGSSTPSYCYRDESNNYHWTSSPEPSWIIVENITKEADCKETEEEACYINPNGEYKWGKYAKTDGYTLVPAIKDSAHCVTPSPEPDPENACYKNEDGNYIWTSTAPEGYSKVEGITNPEDCGPEEYPACYIHNNRFIWGKYAKITGYILIENIETEEECVTPNVDACYKDSDGNYVWGQYDGDPNYTLVPSITSEAQCKSDVPVPATGISTSKIIYIFMAILMACGVGFVYYSTIEKKTN